MTVLACVRTPDAARAIAVCADRLGVSASVRTAVTAVEAIARLAERSADFVFVDGPLTRPDPIGFVRRVMVYAPHATLVVYGLPEPSVASALIAAGARGVIRGGDTDLVTAVTKTVLLLGLTESERLGSAVSAGVGAIATTSGRESRMEPSGPSSATLPAAAPAPRAVSVAKTNLTGLVTAADRLASAMDTRNGGPGYAVPRFDGVERRPERLMPSSGSDSGYGLVPQQRMDPPVAPDARTPTLTERELQVLRGMAEGKSNAEIGRELFVSEDTVKTHARRMFRKLGARDRAHAVASGFRSGLVG